MQVLKKIEKGPIFLFYPEKWNTLIQEEQWKILLSNSCRTKQHFGLYNLGRAMEDSRF